jgi:hypothetical protein
MKLQLALLPVLAAFGSAAAHAQTDSSRAAYYSNTRVMVELRRGEERTWTMTAPGGSYVAFARVDFSPLAGALLGRDGTAFTDARLKCRLGAEGEISNYDEAASLLTTDQVTGSGVLSQTSDSEFFSLVATINPVSFGAAQTIAKVTCTNTSINERANPIPINHIRITLAPVASLQGAPLVAVPPAARAGAAASKPVGPAPAAKTTAPVSPKPQ